MNSAPININARYRLEPTTSSSLIKPENGKAFDVLDRARELRFEPAIIFSNASEAECREWVLRNCEEPVEHTKGPWEIQDPLEPNLAIVKAGLESYEWDFIATIGIGSSGDFPIREAQANAALIVTAPKLLALLETYHQCFPTKESGKLICEARNWAIQE